jgi:hypothetical protein
MRKRIIGAAIFILLIGYFGWEMTFTGVAPSTEAKEQREPVQHTQTFSARANITDDQSTAGFGSMIPNAPKVAVLTSDEYDFKAFPSDKTAAPTAKLAPSIVSSSGATIYVFHSKIVVETEEPTESEKSRLHQAIELATEGVRNPIVVLDADAQSLSGTPCVLYAKDRFDLTEAIKTSYLRLDATSSPTKVITQSQQQ